MTTSAIDVTVSMDRETKLRLANIAEDTSRTEEDLALEAVHHFLDVQEWQKAEIEKTLQRSLAGTVKKASHADVVAWVHSIGTDQAFLNP